jgi:ribose transport system substrate-binding protein
MKSFVIILCVIFVLCLNCNREGDRSVEPDKIKIALVLKTLNSPFFIELHKGAAEAAKKENIELVVQAPEREIDVEKQMQIIENLIQTQVNAICVSPSGSRELLPAIAKANNAKIPILIVDTRIDEKAAREQGIRALTFIGSDNYQGGRLAGEYVANLSDNMLNVVILEGIPGHETGDNRLRGFTDEISKFNNIKIIAAQPANWERDQGYNVMQNLIQAHPGINLVFACNDLMALGAMEAVIASGKIKQIKIIGFDAVEEARKEIQLGHLEASIAQHPEEMGRLAIEYAIKAVKGEMIPEYIPVKIELITR